MTSPTRPIAWLSDDIIENTPRSCRMSSAAIVSRRMRLSAKARSSAIAGIEVVAHHQHVEVLVDRVDGVRHRRVGRRRQHVRQARARLMMSGAWPPPAPSVWKVAIVRPLNAAIVSSTKPGFVQRVGVDRDLHVVAVGHARGSCRSRPASCPSPRAASGRRRRPRPARRARRAGWRCPCPGSRGSSGKPSRPPSASSGCATAPACRWSRRCRWPGRCRRPSSSSRRSSAPLRSAAGR